MFLCIIQYPWASHNEKLITTAIEWQYFYFFFFFLHWNKDSIFLYTRIAFFYYFFFLFSYKYYWILGKYPIKPIYNYLSSDKLNHWRQKFLSWLSSFSETIWKNSGFTVTPSEANNQSRGDRRGKDIAWKAAGNKLKHKCKW